jgi:hypothetical protein
MPIMFFLTQCKTSSNNENFGLCDNPPPAIDPAYIDEYETSKWIGIVHNPTSKNVDFYAIDHCITILKTDGNIASRCDGMLRYDNTLLFVELKQRGSSGWLLKARNQLAATIAKFKEDNNFTDYDKVEAYACNSLRPSAIQGNNTELQKFKDDTGLIMYAQQNIYI